MNTVSLGPDNIIMAAYVGDQTEDTITQTWKETIPMVKELRDKGLPIKVILDLSKLTGQNSSARRAARDVLLQLAPDKMAVIGANTFIRYLAGFIFKATNMEKNIKQFPEMKDAAAWINS
ncbi:MAG TPA: hypothetical protein VLH19_02240 [Patescibacteria group bacterium]|nr:hypothetical protein [Patescibacteria group bacterium]